MAAQESERLDSEFVLDAEAAPPSGSWWMDLDTREIEWSPELHAFFGQPLDCKPDRKRARACVHPDDYERLMAVINDREQRGGSFRIVYRVLRNRGEIRLVESTGWFKTAGDGARHALGTVVDITEAAHDDRRRRQSAEQAELALRIAGDGVCGLDAAGCVLFHNPALTDLVGRPEHEITGAAFHDLVHVDPDGSEPHPAADCPYRRETPGQERGIDADFLTGSGKGLEVSYTRSGHQEDGQWATVISLRDVTAARIDARRLQRSLEEIRTLSSERGALLRQLTAAEERERLRIAADIHDDSVQTLRALELILERRRDEIGDARAAELLDSCRHEVQGAAARLRGLMFELLPPGPEASLRDAVVRYADSLLADSEITCEVHGEVRDLSSGRFRLAYRLIQEAMRNAKRHSRGAKIEVTLAADDENLQLTIADDGVGLSEPAVLEHEPGGLRIIRQRVEAAGGEATVGPGLGRWGLAIAIRLPLSQEWPS